MLEKYITTVDNSLSLTVVWFHISRTEIETCWLYLLSCMHYDCLVILYNEISDLLQGDKIVLGNPSVCQKLVDYSSIQHFYIIFIQLWSWSITVQGSINLIKYQVIKKGYYINYKNSNQSNPLALSNHFSSILNTNVAW